MATWASGEKMFLGIGGLTLRDREGLDEEAGCDPRIGCRDGGETSTCGLLQSSGDETGVGFEGQEGLWRSEDHLPDSLADLTD